MSIYTRLRRMCPRWTALVVVCALIGTVSCRREASVPAPGASEREVEKLLGTPAVVDNDSREFEGDIRRLGDCLKGKRDAVNKVWRYHKPEGQETIVAFDKGGHVLCAKAGGMSIIH